MKYKIVADSSSNLLSLSRVPFTSVPLHVVVGKDDFIDDETIDLPALKTALSSYKGKTSTACPGPEDWLRSFEDAETVFCFTITSALSGAFASANVAKQLYEGSYPDRRVYVLDALTTGPELTLIVRKAEELICAGLEPEQIYETLREYCHHTRLFISLSSLECLAKNGRVSMILAKGVGILGLRIIGTASAEGTLQPMGKARGEKKGIDALIKQMTDCGFSGGSAIISHSGNTTGAELLKAKILEKWPSADCTIMGNGGLCTYYAEADALLLGFET